jgi:hypothetical protein
MRIAGTASFNYVDTLEADFGTGCVHPPIDLNHGAFMVLANYLYLRTGVFLGGATLDAPTTFIGPNTGSEAWMRKVRVSRVLEVMLDGYGPIETLWISGIWFDNGLLKPGSAGPPRTASTLYLSNASGGPTAGCVGTTGIYVRNSLLDYFIIASTVTLSGAGGNVRLANGQILSYASLDSAPVVDATGSTWRRLP